MSPSKWVIVYLTRFSSENPQGPEDRHLVAKAVRPWKCEKEARVPLPATISVTPRRP